MKNHPPVSEEHEGRPWFEWTVAGLVAVSTLLTLLGYAMAAVTLIATTAILGGVLRLMLRERSPWKVRSVAFDAFIGIGLGLGLLITYLSIGLIL